jgi:hypothetical protein
MGNGTPLAEDSERDPRERRSRPLPRPGASPPVDTLIPFEDYKRQTEKTFFQN